MKTELKAIAEEQNFKVLYACESGSRVWGFASPDSDYDVRFIYVMPFENYMTVGIPPADNFKVTIDDKDIVGWDLKKTLNLFSSWNPSLLEWLASPVVYIGPHNSIMQLQEWSNTFYNPTANMGHYYGMTLGHYKKYIAEKETIKLKKYLYTIRTALALNWIRRTNLQPPVELLKLAYPHGELFELVKGLVGIQREATEDLEITTMPIIDTFISEELTTMPGLRAVRTLPLADLDRLFRKTVMQ
jgi:predicted nucleotidyltransferase